MFNVIIIQELKDGTISRSLVSYETKDLAMSRFHQELAQIGIAEALKRVSCYVLDDNLAGIDVKTESVTEDLDPAEA